jgi:heterodisulfide reductase subunit B
MKIGYFPGCSLHGSSREYDESLRAISPAIGIDLEEIPDWNCCGATAAHSTNRMLSLALPARSLALAERAGMTQVLVPCSACYSRLVMTRSALLEDEALRKEVCEIIAMDYKGTAKVVNVLELLAAAAKNGLAGKIAKPFKHKVACYYGCYLVRPPKVVKFDRPEDPESMDELMRAIGADSIDWAFKVECCGAGFSVSRLDLVAKLSAKIVEDAVHRGAEAIIVACPMCHTNLDLRRDAIEESANRQFAIPVLYVTQAIGLALGMGERQLGLHRHNVPVSLPGQQEAGATAASGV